MASAAGRPRRPPFLVVVVALLLLLVLAGAARGNEGGAAGSCPCKKHKRQPRLLTDYAERLQSCDTCKDLVRFHFPQIKVCGLRGEPWVINYSSSHCPEGSQEEGVRGADASRGHGPPAPTPQSTAAAPESSAWPARASLEKSPEPSRRAAAWGPERAWSPPPPSVDAAARGAGRTPAEPGREGPPPATDAKTPVIALLCLSLALVGVVVFMLCRRKRQRRSRSRGDRAPRLPPGEQEEASLCLPGEKT